MSIFAADDEKPDMRIRQGVFDDTLDAEIFGVECADHRKACRGRVLETGSECVTVQGAGGYRRPVFKDMVVTG
jgi:hypothetical protein